MPQNPMTFADALHRSAARIARRHCRIAAVAYLLAMTIGLHWPRLELGTSDAPAPSRIIHALAFAGLTILLWNTGWFVRLWWLTTVLVAWGVLNELMQGMITVGRTVSGFDATANILGVLIASAWVAALSRQTAVGGEVNHMRLAQQRWVADELLARPLLWVLLIGGAAPVGITLIVAWPQAAQAWRAGWPGVVLLAAYGAWAGGILTLLIRMWRGAERRLRRDQPCLHCGEMSGDRITFDEGGVATCPTCGGDVHAGHWIEPMGPPPGMLRRLIAAPVIVCAAMIAGIFGLLSLVVAIHGWMVAEGMDIRLFVELGRRRSDLPTDFVLVVDAAVLLGIAAMGVRMYRGRLARYHDEQSMCCRTCGHDLRGTPSPGGLGRCGECGARFLRAGSPPDRQRDSA